MRTTLALLFAFALTTPLHAAPRASKTRAPHAKARAKAAKTPPPPAAPAPAPEAPKPEPEAPKPEPEPEKPTPPPAAPVPPPPKAETSPAASVDLDALSAEYHALKDELFRARAKAEIVGAALYKTKLKVKFEYLAQRAWPIKRVTLKVDEQPVASMENPQAADSAITLYDGFAVPGRHTLSLRVECGAVGDTRMAYASEDSFTFDFQDGKLTQIEFSVDENGHGPQELAQKHAGTFDVRTFAKVRTLKLEEKK